MRLQPRDLVRIVEAVGYRFHVLTMREMMELADTMQRRVLERLEAAAGTKFNIGQRIMLTQEIESNPPTVSQAVRFGLTPAGTQDVLRIALRKEHPGADVDDVMAALGSPIEVAEMCSRLMQLDRTAGNGEVPDPTKASAKTVADVMTGTGNAKPPSSESIILEPTPGS